MSEITGGHEETSEKDQDLSQENFQIGIKTDKMQR